MTRDLGAGRMKANGEFLYEQHCYEVAGNDGDGAGSE